MAGNNWGAIRSQQGSTHQDPRSASLPIYDEEESIDEDDGSLDEDLVGNKRFRECDDDSDRGYREEEDEHDEDDGRAAAASSSRKRSR